MSTVRMVAGGSATAALLVGLATGCVSDGGDTLTVVSPAAGHVVNVPFEVTVDSSVPLGPQHEGMHHVHIWFGDDHATQTIGEDATVQINNAPDGEHEMHVSLRHADHSPAGVEISMPIVISNGAG